MASQSFTLGELKRMSVEDLMNLEVTSVTRRPERLADAPAAVTVITGEEIRRHGASTLVEALRLAPNLQVAQRGSRGWAVSARGFNTELANKLLVMVDGRSVYTPLFSGVFWEAQGYILEDVERIEVVSGPGGTLWGTNAVNGVVSVITRSAADTHGLLATAAHGPELNVHAALRYGGEISPGVHWRVFGKYVDHEQAVRTDRAPAGDDWHRAHTGFRMDADAAAGAFTLQGEYYDNDEEDPEAASSTRLKGAHLLGRLARSTGAGGELSLQAYVDWTRFDDAVPPLTLGGVPLSGAGRFRDDLVTFDLDFQHSFRPHRRHVVTWGLGFRHMRDDVDSAPALAVLPERLDQQLYSLFAQDEMQLGRTLTLTLGTKLEHHDYTGLEVQPSARLQWQPAASPQMLWAAVSRAVRIPSRLDRELYQAQPPGFPLLYGNPDFRSEKLVAYELGHRATLGGRASTSLSLFFNDYDDVRSTTITPEVLLPFRFANDVYGRTWGLEFSGNVQVRDGWSVRAGYTLLEERLKVRPGRLDIANARNEVADPEQQALLGTSLDLPRGVEFDAALRWVDRLRVNNGPDVGTVPDYLELDARVGWQATPRLDLSLIGRNLLHRRHAEYGFPGPGRVQVERSVYGRLVWRH